MGVALVELFTHPEFAISIQPVVIMVDIGIYSFFTWLFWDDMRLQFLVRLKKLRGTVGFRWQNPKSLRDLKEISR